MVNKAPVHEVKFGRVRAAAWANEGASGVWHSVRFARLYKNAEGMWQDADSFNREGLPLLIKAADEVHTWMYRSGERTAENGPDAEAGVDGEGGSREGG